MIDRLKKIVQSDHAAVILVWSCLLLEPFGRMVELPTAVMALAGLILVAKRGRELLLRGGGRLFTILFLLIWVPMLLSLPTAFRPAVTALNILIYLRFYLAGLFVVATMGDPKRQRLLLRLSAWLLLFWVADALVQAVHGVDLFGYVNLDPRHLNGVFGQRLHLGVFLAVLSSLLLVHSRRRWRPWAQLLTFGATTVVVLLAGSRGGWINFGLMLAAYFVFLLGENRRLALRLAAGVALVLALGTAFSYHYAPGFNERVSQSLLVFKGNEKDVNKAISGRVPIWTVSLEMFAAHPLTGIGACGYRYAYPQYAAPSDPFYHKKTGPTHPHQILLEMMSETGVIGLASLLAFFALLIVTWHRADRESRWRMLPYGLALWGALFPMNTGFALYSAIWGQVIFWFVSLYVASGQVKLGQVESSADG